MRLEPVEDAVNERLKDVELGACGMAVTEAVGFKIGHREQMAVAEFVEEIGCVLDMRRTLRRIAHDRRSVLERIADVTIPVAACADQHVNRVGGTTVKARCGIESAAIKGPADVLFVERVANGA